MKIKNYNLNNNNKFNKYFFILSFIFIFILVSVIIFSEDKWKLKIKGQEKETPTNPIIKGTNVFVDIYDLSVLFNIDYEINLTRKYIMFYKNINLPNVSSNNYSNTSNSTITATNNPKKNQDKSELVNKDTTSNLQTTNSSSTPNFSNLSYDNSYLSYSDKYYSNTSINKIILKEINSIKNIVIIDAINEIKPLYKDSIVYKEELNNIKDRINDSFISKLSIPVIVDKNQNINALNIKEILDYLNKRGVSAAIIPIIRAYEYHEKSENIMNPEVQLIIDYILINNKGDILYFDSQNVIRGLAVFSSSSTRYRKSKLLDLIDISVFNFINNFNRYKEIINKF